MSKKLLVNFLAKRIINNVKCQTIYEKILYVTSFNLLKKVSIRFRDKNEINWHLSPVEVIDRHLLTEGVWEPHITDYMKNNFKEETVFFDVGANIGYNTLLASKLSPSGKVISFEPNPVANGKMKNNMSLNNNTKNIEIIEACVSDKDCELLFYVSPENAANSGRASLIKQEGYQEIKVSSVVIDELIDKGEIPEPNIIKIDVEGAELAVLKSMKKTLLRSNDVEIIIEVSSPENVVSEAAVFLNELGFKETKISQEYQTEVNRETLTQYDAVFRKYFFLNLIRLQL